MAPNDSPASLFRSSLHRCLGAPGFFESFYASFIEASDEVKEKFKDTDMRRQARMLEDSLFVLAVAAQGGEDSPARSALPDLARKHSRKGHDIRPELYDLWLEALIQTAKIHDHEFSPEVEAAWREVLAPGIQFMRSGYEKP